LDLTRNLRFPGSNTPRLTVEVAGVYVPDRVQVRDAVFGIAVAGFHNPQIQIASPTCARSP
jgi:hypothetical protein